MSITTLAAARVAELQAELRAAQEAAKAESANEYQSTIGKRIETVKRAFAPSVDRHILTYWYNRV